MTVDSVSVWLVIEPCWKLGTTGTAFTAVLPLKSSSTVRSFLHIIIYNSYQRMVTSDTNWPVAVVPAPPAVNSICPAELIVPAKPPVYPPAVVVV